MKNQLNNPKTMFSLLMAVCVLAMALGVYLCAALGVGSVLAGTHGPAGPVIALCLAALALWLRAWGAFLGLCGYLRRGNAAFCGRSEKALACIRGCLLWLCGLTLLMGLLCGRGGALAVIDCVLLPGLFGGVALAAWVLLALLRHARWLEKEQEGVI